MPKLSFTNEEITLIKDSVNQGHSSWSNIELSEIRSKIKEHHKLRQEDCCCYCCRNIYGEFNFVLDIEHILPKSKKTNLMFTQKNLSVSCKRCNMNIKGNDLSFLSVNLIDLPNRLFKSKFYKIIHPNLDRYESHLLLHHVQIGRKRLIKYQVNNDSEKGRYTYDYFKLRMLEINRFDQAQGLESRITIDNIEIEKEFSRLVDLQGS